VASISLVEATRSPWTFSPAAVFPENVKTGMVRFSFFGCCATLIDASAGYSCSLAAPFSGLTS
jgi:hypothetical protein